MNRTQSPIACRLDSLTETQREREKALLKFVREATLERKELATGYALRLPNDSATVLQIAEFITLERLCCPYFDFELQVQAEAGPVWLQLTGRDGVKDFLAGMFNQWP